MPFRHFFQNKFHKEPPSPPPPASQPPRRVPNRQSPAVHRADGSEYYEVVCPYCMERYPVWDLEFRSLSVAEGDSESNGYPRHEDQKYKDFWKKMHQPVMLPEQNFVLQVSDSENVIAVQLWDSGSDWLPLDSSERRGQIQHKAIRGVKDKFGVPSYQHICPKCHNNLPGAIGRFPNYIISMMGNTFSGKTAYISRLLLSLMNGELLPGYRLSITILSENESLPVLRKRLNDMFFRAVRQTKTEETNSPSQALTESTPIAYMKPTILDMQRGNEHILLTLFDFPGEAIWKLDNDDQYFFHQLMERTNENADGWLFLFDSTTLPPVRTCILDNEDQAYLSQNGENQDANFNAEPMDVLSQFCQFFGKDNLISSPTALTFSKADMISRYASELEEKGYDINPDSTFLHNAAQTRRERVDLDDLWKCDRELRQFLEKAQGTILTHAENFCPTHAWFAVSSTGMPIKNGQIEQMAPALRVLEPLEWLLWILGAYPGEYMQGKNPIWGRTSQSDKKGDAG